MTKQIVVHLDSPSISPTITRVPLGVSGWVLVPDSYCEEKIQKELKLNVLIEYGGSLSEAQFSNVLLAGRRLEAVSGEDFFLSKPFSISRVGRRIQATGYESHFCYDFSAQIDGKFFSSLSSEPVYGRLIVSAEIDQLRALSEQSHLTFSLRQSFSTARGGFYSPVSSFSCSDSLYIEGWAIRLDDCLAEVTISIENQNVGTLVCGLEQRSSSSNFPDIAKDGVGFAGILDRSSILKSHPNLKLDGSGSLYADCRFCSGEILRLEIPNLTWEKGLSKYEKRKQIFGSVESVKMISQNRVQFSGWVVDAAGRCPEFVLRSGKKELRLSEAGCRMDLEWIRRADIERQFSEIVFDRDAGFQLSFDAGIFGQSPGKVALDVVFPGKEKRLTNFWSEISVSYYLSKFAKSKGTLRLIFHWMRFVKQLCVMAPSDNVVKSKSKKKILFAMHNCSFVEGAPKVFFNIAKYISKHYPSWELHMVTPIGGGLEDDFRKLGISVSVIPELAVSGMTLAKYYSGLAKVCRLLDEVEFDFVYANVIDSFYAIDAAFRIGVPSSWLIHESVNPLNSFPDLPMELRRIFLTRLESVEELMFVSDATMKLFQGQVNHARMSVVSNGIDIAAIDVEKESLSKIQARQILDIASDTVVVTIIGTTTHRKGQDVFLREMAILANQCEDRKFVFMIVGARPSSFLDELRRTAEELNISDKTVFVEETPNVVPYFQASDVMVVASRQESAPLVSLEAFAYKRPLVSTRAFGLAEQVNDKVNALAFELEEIGGLAKSVQCLIEDPQLASSLVELARKDVEERFSLSASLNQHSHHIAESLDLCLKAR